MRSKPLQDSKIKRMLLYWDYLGNLRLDPEASIDFVRYMFSVEERWIKVVIKTRRLTEPELMAIELEHMDIEYKLIEAYAQKLLSEGKKKRPETKHKQ